MGRSHARGFSLIELIVSLAIVIVLGWLLVHALSQALLVGRVQAQDDQEQSTIGRLVDNLTTEEDDAWAIYNPPTDVFGKSNSDGHEVDFFARDGQQRPYFWAYTYDAATKTLTRYRFSSPGGLAMQDTTYTGITKFYAQTYPVTALQDSTSPVYSTLYNGASLQSGTVHFYRSMPWIAGGNNITYVHIEGTSIKQDLQLATQTAPSGFTVVVYYTPSPPPATPAPTPGAPLNTWPVAVAYGANGSNVAYVQPRAPLTFGRMVNQLLGGGIAIGAVTCPAQAYSDSAMTQLDKSDTTYKASLGVYTDANGCIQGPSGPTGWIVASESGFAGGFNETGCSGMITLGRWSPSSSGPVSALSTGGGSSAGTCTLQLSDGSSRTLSYSHGLVSLKVTSGGACGIVGESCTFSVAAPDPQAICTASYNDGGTVQSGYRGPITVDATPSNLGTLTQVSTRKYTFTRTALGGVTVIVRGYWVDMTAPSAKQSTCPKRATATAFYTYSF